MEDLGTWIARATYYEQRHDDARLDETLAETMERLRGCDGTQTRTEG
jgi:hypothetical protein